MRALRQLSVLSLLLIGGCGTLHSMTVPMALNPISAPSRGKVLVQARATANTGVAPSDDRGEPAAYLPRAQIEGGVPIRFSRYFTMRIRAGVFLDVDAQPLNGNGHGAPGRAGYTFGVAPTFTIPIDHGRTLLTVAPDLNVAVMPSVWGESTTCTDADGLPVSCGGDVEQFEMGIVLGGAVGAFRWFGDHVRLGGTLGVRGQPSVGGAFASEPPSALGHVAVVLGAEVLVQVTEGLFFSVESQWLGVVGPYAVYPTVGLTLGGSFGTRGEDPIDPSTWLEGEG